MTEGNKISFTHTKGARNVFSTMQFHPYAELYFFISGKAELVSTRLREEMLPYRLVIIPAGEYHYFNVRTDIEEYERCVINVPENSDLYSVLSELASAIRIIMLDENDRITEHFRYLASASRHFSAEDFSLVLSAALTDILYLIKYGESGRTVSFGAHTSLPDSVMEYLNKHISENITLDALSDIFGYSVSHISHTFVCEFKISIKQYVLNKRLYLARAQIQGGRSINEVFRELGFNSYPSFFRLYKKKFGVSPSKIGT